MNQSRGNDVMHVNLSPVNRGGALRWSGLQSKLRGDGFAAQCVTTIAVPANPTDHFARMETRCLPAGSRRIMGLPAQGREFPYICFVFPDVQVLTV
jgi:hypothetical protein